MNQGVATTDSPSFVNVTATSDERLKTNIKTIEDALDRILLLRGVTFNRKSDGAAEIGVIAQELAVIFPELVTTRSDGMLAVSYGNMVGILIEAIKQLKKEIDELKKDR
jgi:hypothetical protein